jgi:hypothetical protein
MSELASGGSLVRAAQIAPDLLILPLMLVPNDDTEARYASTNFVPH